MSTKVSRLVIFNAKMDGIVNRMYVNSLYSPELRDQMTEMIERCRQIAAYDVDLAGKVLFDSVWLSYLSQKWVLDLVASKSR